MDKTSPHKRLHGIITAFLILVLSLSMTVGAAYYMKIETQREAGASLDYEAKEAVSAVRERLLAYEYLLRGGAGLFAGSDKVKREEWHKYLKTLGVDKNYPGIIGMGFARYVPSSERETFLREVQASGLTDYTIWPEGNRPEYAPILYLEPGSANNRQRLGYDMFTEPSLQAVLDLAKDKGSVVTSRKISLIREANENSRVDFLMIIPVYYNGRQAGTVAERRAALEGFVFSAFRMKDLMKGIMGVEKPLVDIEIFDGAEHSAENLLYDSNSRAGYLLKNDPAITRSTTLEIGNRTWTILITALPAFEGHLMDEDKPLQILAVGGIISILLFTVALSLANSHSRANRMAEKMTAALRASEHRLYTLLQALPVGVFYLDADGNCTYVNGYWNTIFGVESEEALGESWMDLMHLVHPEDRDSVASIRRLAIEKGLPYKYEFRFLRPDGKTIWVESSAHPLKGGDGKVSGYLGTDIDITDRKNAEAGNLAMQARMLHGQKLESLGILAGGIAHDFNNLLMSILGNTEISLAVLPPDSPARGTIEKVRVVVHRASELTRQMLAYSGRGKFVIENIDISNLVEDMTELMKVSIRKNIKVDYQLTKNLPFTEADATQIRQVIMNLIINASDAIGENHGVITVSTGIMDCDLEYLIDAEVGKELAGTTCVYVDISDNGCGMDEETRSRIFDPFFTTKFTGRGLGLAAVLGIVRGHGGALKVHSKPGEGTSFRVLLPVSKRRIEAAPHVTDKKLEGWKGMGTILIADDEEDILSVSRIMLEGKGFNILTALDGKIAVELFREHADEITVVLLDLTMPNMNGEEAFREMKKIRPGVKAILASGYNEEEITSRFGREGFAGFLHKPYEISELMNKLAAIVR